MLYSLETHHKPPTNFPEEIKNRWKRKMIITPLLSCQEQIMLSKCDKICPLAIPNHISLISMHVQSLVKIPWYLIKLSSGNENMIVYQADNSVKIWPNLSISNPKPDLSTINAHNKLGENPLMFTQVIWKRNTDGQMYDWWTDRLIYRHATWYHNTPPLCCVGYKNFTRIPLLSGAMSGTFCIHLYNYHYTMIL